MSKSTLVCCPRPLRVQASVDRILPEVGLRLRHLPGEVCLRCRDISVLAIAPSPSLEEAIDRCFQGDLSGVTILKARTENMAGSFEQCSVCSGDSRPASLDIALGDHAGLVAEGIAGHWCWTCGTATIQNGGGELQQRLLRLASTAAGTLVPSLVYDTPTHPRSVQMEVTTRCNLRCGYCSHQYLNEQYDLPLARFHQLLAQIDLRHVDNVDFTGLGEPVLHPHLPEFVRELRRRASPTHIRVVTNGTVLTPNRFEPLCEAGITSIAFSIDSLDPTRFERSRTGANLHKVLGNLEALVAYRARHNLNHLSIKIKAVLLDEPYGEAEKLLTYSAQVGIEMPHFSCLDSREHATQQYEQPWLQSNWVEKSGAAFAHWTEARWQELTATSPPPTAAPAYPTPAQREAGFAHPSLTTSLELCRWAVDAAFVSISGNCLSCCEQMIDLPRQHWSSLDATSLTELWQGELLWGYRLPLSLGQLPNGCVGCAWAPRDGQPMEEAPQSDQTNQLV